MGHANSKHKKKGLDKEKHRSRSFTLKSKNKKENNSSNNLNNININIGNNSNDNDNDNNNNTTTTTTNTTTTTTTTTTSTSPPPSPSPSPLAESEEKKLDIKDVHQIQVQPHNDGDNNQKLDFNKDKDGDRDDEERRRMSMDSVSTSNEKKRSKLRESTVMMIERPASDPMLGHGARMMRGMMGIGLDDVVIIDDHNDDMCPLCEETGLDMYSMEVCGHSVCVPCLYAYSEYQLKHLAADAHEILCPVPECTCIISGSDLQAAMDTFGARLAKRNHTTTSSNGKGADGDGADGDVIGEDLSVASGKRKSSDVAGISGLSGDDASNSSGVSGKEAEIEGDAVVEEVGESSSSARTNEYVPRLPIKLTHSLELLLSKGNYIHCPNPECKFVFERLPPSSRRKNEVVLDDAGNPISPESSKHREEHRFRCRVCGTNFCAACKSVPYHLGFTCKQKMAAMRAKHCRFCNVALPANAKPYNARTTPVLPKKKDKNYRKSFLLAMKWKGKEKSKPDLSLVDIEPEATVEVNPKEFFVCKSKDCTSKMLFACSRFLDCGHVCSGTSTDLPSECFCLKEGCCEEGKQNSEEFCNICWTETLGSGPCYRLGCSHVFHVSCVTSKLSKEWPGPSISFAFLNCPLCSQIMQHRSLERSVHGHRQLLEQVKTRALQRLEFEGMMNDPRVTDPESDFHDKPTEYAMSIFSFYLCFVCRNPYFGGRRQCEVPQAAEGAEAAPFNPQELLCGGCSTLNAKCSKHGKEYIEYKCRFCCSLATFYCGGKAHFCTACHDKAGQLVEFINWTTTAKCEPCKGPGLCPLGMQHKENGEEFSLGCSICRLSGV